MDSLNSRNDSPAQTGCILPTEAAKGATINPLAFRGNLQRATLIPGVRLRPIGISNASNVIRFGINRAVLLTEALATVSGSDVRRLGETHPGADPPRRHRQRCAAPAPELRPGFGKLAIPGEEGGVLAGLSPGGLGRMVAAGLAPNFPPGEHRPVRRRKL